MINRTQSKWKNSQKYNTAKFNHNTNRTKAINRTHNQRGGIKL